MDISAETVDGVAIAEIVSDSLDASNAKEFKSLMASVVKERRKLVLDMSNLRFVDSSGLGVILSCMRELTSKGGDLKLCAMTNPVRGLFELVRMHKVMDILNSREEALAAFSEQ